MIEKIYIIDNSGICLFSKSYKEESKEDEIVLISGFLTSIDKFAQFTANAGKIDEIKLQNAVFKYKNYEKFKVIVRINELIKKEEDSRKLSLIGDIFFNKFNHLLNSWDGNIDIFQSFSKDLNIIEHKDQNVFAEFTTLFEQKIASKERDVTKYKEYLLEFKSILSQYFENSDKIIQSIDNWLKKLQEYDSNFILEKDLKKLFKDFQFWEKEGVKKFKESVLKRIESF